MKLLVLLVSSHFSVLLAKRDITVAFLEKHRSQEGHHQRSSKLDDPASDRLTLPAAEVAADHFSIFLAKRDIPVAFPPSEERSQAGRHQKSSKLEDPESHTLTLPAAEVAADVLLGASSSSDPRDTGEGQFKVASDKVAPDKSLNTDEGNVASFEKERGQAGRHQRSSKLEDPASHRLILPVAEVAADMAAAVAADMLLGVSSSPDPIDTGEDQFKFASEKGAPDESLKPDEGKVKVASDKVASDKSLDTNEGQFKDTSDKVASHESLQIDASRHKVAEKIATDEDLNIEGNQSQVSLQDQSILPGTPEMNRVATHRGPLLKPIPGLPEAMPSRFEKVAQGIKKGEVQSLTAGEASHDITKERQDFNVSPVAEYKVSGDQLMSNNANEITGVVDYMCAGFMVIVLALIASASMKRYKAAVAFHKDGSCLEPTVPLTVVNKKEYLENSAVESFLQCPENQYCADRHADENTGLLSSDKQIGVPQFESSTELVDAPEPEVEPLSQPPKLLLLPPNHPLLSIPTSHFQPDSVDSSATLPLLPPSQIHHASSESWQETAVTAEESVVNEEVPQLVELPSEQRLIIEQFLGTEFDNLTEENPSNELSEFIEVSSSQESKECEYTAGEATSSEKAQMAMASEGAEEDEDAPPLKDFGKDLGSWLPSYEDLMEPGSELVEVESDDSVTDEL